MDKKGFSPLSGQRVVHTCALVFLFFLLMTPPPGAARESPNPSPEIKARLDRESAAVGSAVTLTLEYRLPEGAKTDAQPKIGGLEDRTVLEYAAEPGRITVSLLVDRLGTQHIGPLTLPFKDREGEEHLLKAGPVSLTVLSNLGDKPGDATLRPIRDIVPGARGWVRVLLWAAAGVGFAMGAMAFWWFRRKRKGGMEGRPEVPPHVRARRALSELEARGLFEEGHVKGFYFAFSEIMRQYMGAIRGFPAVDFTTEEIAAAVRDEGDRALVRLLQKVDFIKFADAVPTLERKEDHVREALSYIRQTAPQPADEGQPEGGP
jgi:hypothetical protein